MRIALAQIDTTVGDLEGNAQRIREATTVAREKGAEIVVFPELTVSGYDPRDFLRMTSFLEACERTVASLAEPAEWNRDVALIVGFPERNEERDGAPAFNSCAFIHGGRVRAVARKSLLPSYDVLEESRHFQPAAGVAITRFRDLAIGLSICEDVWSSPRFHSRRRHLRDPVAELVAAGADIVVNLSASPYHIGKPKFRGRMLSSLAEEHGAQLVMVNSVGGNDGTIFDGNSLAVAADGRVALRCAAFEEDIRVFDTAEATEAERSDSDDSELDELKRALVLGIRGYCNKSGFQRAALGLSGGVDSALVATLAAEALGPDNVLALAMPSRYSSEGSLTDARRLAENLGFELRELSIEPPLSALLDELAPHLGETGSDTPGGIPSLTVENLQPRARATYLMAFSNAMGHLVLAPGNKSEIAVGYSTLYGDMAGGLCPIGDVLKTRAWALCRRINEEAGEEVIPSATIDKPPSAELRPDQMDTDSLPPYEALDPIIAAFVEEALGLEAIVERGHDRELASRVIRMILGAEYKRRQGAPILKVTPAPFVSGYRLPMAHRWRPWE